VSPWIDPSETDRERWTSEPEPKPTQRSVYERAHGTSLPYERAESLTLSGPDVADEFDTKDYDKVKLRYNIGVDLKGRVKLLSKGHLWGTEEVHQRFRVQYRRPPEPTAVEPFEEYSAWMRYRQGTVDREPDGTLSFDSNPVQTEEKTVSLAWPDMYSTDQIRIAEAERSRTSPLVVLAVSVGSLPPRRRPSMRPRREVDEVCWRSPILARPFVVERRKPAETSGPTRTVTLPFEDS
jgi:hypothetical protein